jgi:ankyrin repeat protein
MKSRIAFSTFLTLCLFLASCGRQNATNNAQVAALFRATREGNTEMVRSLLSAPGIDVNATDESGSTPLLEAARFGHDDICRTLIAAGANLKSKDKDGKTALQLAIQGDHDEVVRVLKQAGANE